MEDYIELVVIDPRRLITEALQLEAYIFEPKPEPVKPKEKENEKTDT